MERVCARLSKWKWLLPQLSYRGRVLIVNNLVALTLWHRLIALPPPRGLMEFRGQLWISSGQGSTG